MGDTSSVHLCAYNAIKALTLTGDSSIKLKHSAPNQLSETLPGKIPLACILKRGWCNYLWTKALLFDKV